VTARVRSSRVQITHLPNYPITKWGYAGDCATRVSVITFMRVNHAASVL
jgi:hypothetical protein